MEGKTLILSVLIMILFMAQSEVEAKSCCPSTNARNVYNLCLLVQHPRSVCARISQCKIVQENTCPPGYPKDNLENSGDVNEYCTLGCVSSVCGAITTLQGSDENEIVNGAVEQCTKACSTFCAKGSLTPLKTA
ncbi:hypothetical protein AALP_AA1G023900 [Arabis alpina]|uniref:Acidic protein n=1 Tax=Arabis alpina TaxID=50452 RepID=A0A087HKL3_ARAAL|nr:hypothetical protein AALP_AA1G023900 [Arabis alpina]